VKNGHNYYTELIVFNVYLFKFYDIGHFEIN